MAHYLENNSTDIPLNANEIYIGQPVIVETNQITASCSFSTDVPGTLEFLHSFDGFQWFNFDDSFNYIQGSHNRQVRLKASFFKIKYINGVLPQTSFNLYTKILIQLNDDMNVNISADHGDSILVRAEEGGLDIRSLTTQLDSVRVPFVEECISNVDGTTGLNVFGSFSATIDSAKIRATDGGDIFAIGGSIKSHITNFNSIPKLNSTTDSVSAYLVSGSVVGIDSNYNNVTVSNQLSNYALESTLSNIKTNSDKLTFNNTNLKVLESNSGSILSGITTINDTLTNGSGTIKVVNPTNGQPLTIDGNVSIDNQIVGYATEFTLGDVSNNTSVLNNLQFTETNNLKVEVSNLSDGITILNFPQSFEVSVTDGITILNFPTSTEISNFPTSTEISNFPATQNVIIENTNPISVTGNFFQSVQPITGSIIVQSGLISVTSMPFLTSQTDSVTAFIGNTNPISVEISNIPATQPISGTVNVANFPTGITVNNFPSSFQISNGITVNNYAIKAMIDDGEGNLTLQDLQGVISASGYNSLSVYNYDLDTKFHNDSTFTNAIETVVKNQVGITGHVIVDNISNTSIVGEVGTNVFINNTMNNPGIVAIHANKGGTVKDLNASSHGALYTEVYDSNNKMKIDNNGSNYSVLTDSSGHQIASTNTNGSVYALNTHDYHISQAYNATNTSINTSFTNTSISSKLQDGLANNITSTTNSTKRGIDCNVINSGSIATTDTNLTFDASNNLNVNIASGSISVSSVNVKDSSGNNLSAVSSTVPSLKTTLYDEGGNVIGTSTGNPIKCQIVNTSNVPVAMSGLSSSVVIGNGSVNSDIKRLDSSDTITSTYGLVSKSVVCGVVSGTANPIGMTIGSALKVNVENTSVPVSGSVSITGTPSVSISGTPTVSTTISASTSSIQIGNGTTNASIASTISNIKTNNALVCDSALYGLNISTGDVQPLTVNLNGSRNQLETRDNDAVAELTTIDNKIVQGYNTTNDGAVIGLNTYSIYPKYKYYSMRGRSTVADANMIFGGVNNSRYFYSDAFGTINTKVWYAYSESVSRTIYYEYVDGSGNIGNGTKLLPATTWTQLPLQSGVNGNFLINKWSQSINTSQATNQLYISHTTQSSSHCAFGGYYQDNYNSLFTVPNGYVACITNVMFYSNAGDDYLLMVRWSASGLRDIAYYWTNAKYINQNYAGQYGGVGLVFTAGETIAFATLNTASYKDFSATIQLMPV